MSKASSKIISPGGGKDYDWFLDHIFVKMSGDDTGGLYTILEDNLEPGCKLGLHLHRKYTETFYILEGEIEFTLRDETFLATTGTVIHVPPDTPHGAEADKPCRILMIYSPAGIEGLLERYTQLSSEQFEDANLMRSIHEQHDLFDLPERNGFVRTTATTSFHLQKI